MLQRMDDQGGFRGLDQLHVSGFAMQNQWIYAVTVPSVVHELSENIFLECIAIFFKA